MLDFWIGSLFAIGSMCFALGSFPPYAQNVSVSADGVTFFVGSLFFTTAAFLQLVQALRAHVAVDRWASAIQFVGTLFFNATTWHALDTSLNAAQADQLVWRPDAFGSICFLASSALRVRRARHAILVVAPARPRVVDRGVELRRIDRVRHLRGGVVCHSVDRRAAQCTVNEPRHVRRRDRLSPRRNPAAPGHTGASRERRSHQ